MTHWDSHTLERWVSCVLTLEWCEDEISRGENKHGKKPTAKTRSHPSQLISRLARGLSGRSSHACITHIPAMRLRSSHSAVLA